jgi:hypothetical protein
MISTLRSRLKNSVRLPASFGGNIDYAANDRSMKAAKAEIDRAAWTSSKALTRLPTGEFDEGRAIDLVATTLIPLIQTTPGYSRKVLEAVLQKLRDGEPSITSVAFSAAEAGDEIADAMLRKVYVEIVDGDLPQRGPGHIQIRAYGQRVMLRASHKRRRGRSLHDNLMRNIEICLLIVAVCHDLGVPATRNQYHHSKSGAKQPPSGISIVVAALDRNGTDLDEESVQRHIWFGTAGEMVRSVTHFRTCAANDEMAHGGSLPTSAAIRRSAAP